MAGVSCLPKFLLSLTVLGIIGCLSFEFAGEWELYTDPTPSSTSGYYVLHDWQNTYNQEGGVSPLPATAVSDVMLKTMGILRDGAKWDGVLMGNLFSRPHATALFVVDGISDGSSLSSLATLSYKVDQTGLTGCTCRDMRKMFEGDNVATHLNNLFDQNSQTYSISANSNAAKSAAADDSYTPEEQLKNMIESVQNGQLSLASYGMESVAKKLELTNKVDATFLAELVLVRQSVEQLQDLRGYVNDGAPDVFIYTISGLSGMQQRYGAKSSKMELATQLVKDTIQYASQELVKLYNEKILVQALVLTWNYPDLPRDSPVLDSAYQLLQPFLKEENKEDFISALPKVHLDVVASNDPFLCSDLLSLLKGSVFHAHCPSLPQPSTFAAYHANSRELRAADDPVAANMSNSTLCGLAESRTNDFAAVFLITIFLVISLGIALYAVSWMMWTMDPGKDSVIYRQVSDPTEGMRMQ